MQTISKIIGLAILGLWTTSGLAQDFPGKQPIRILTTAPGAAADILARLSADALSRSLGVATIVENRGGNAIIPTMQVAQSAPNGHTLMSMGGNFFWLQPYFTKDVPYDPVKDFAPVSLTASAPNLLVVNPTLPVKNVKELIAYAKANPGKLNLSAGGVGAGNHLAVELFIAMADIKAQSVNYKGGAPALAAVVSGEVQGMFPGVATVAGLAKAGKVRALAVTTAKPTDMAPGLPTVGETLPGFISGADYVVFAPAKTPAATVDRINRIISDKLQTPDVKKTLFNQGIEVVASSPAELDKYMKADIARVGKLIRDRNLNFMK